MYTGTKFYARNVTQVRDDTQWWTDVRKEKVEFAMTRSYKTYLHNKRIQEREHAIQVLKHKLEYQMRTYGEVDDVDFNEYMGYVKGLK